MNKIIAFALKMSGAGWVWNTINGYKTKLSAIGMMLSGTSMMCIGLVEIINAIVACDAMSCIVGVVRGISENPFAKTVAEGFIVFNVGLGMLGVGHKIDKSVPATGGTISGPVTGGIQ